MGSAEDRLQAVLAANLDRLQFVLLTALDSEHGRSIVEDELEEELRLAEQAARDEKIQMQMAQQQPQQPALQLLPANATKRKRFERCEQCEREFDVASNGHDHCVWHSGNLVVNSQEGYWCGAGAENIDTRENRDKFPEAFVWSCCNEQSDADGCLVGYHRACVSSQKKSRS